MTAAPTGIRRSTRFMPEVESLRGLAITLVFLHHADGLLFPQVVKAGSWVSPLRAFITAGHTGVSLFFVLSAFCLSAPFFRSAQGQPPFSIRRYYARRALRILPLYWTVLAVGSILAMQTAHDLLRALPWSVFLNSFPGLATPIPPYTIVMWSLAAEAQFYVLLPLLPVALRSASGRRAALAALVVYAACYFAFVATPVASRLLAGGNFAEAYDRVSSISLSLFGRGPVLLTGIAVAWIHEHHGAAISQHLRASPMLRSGGSDLVLLLLLTATGYLLRWQASIGGWNTEMPPYQAWHVAEGVLWGSILLLLMVAPLRSKPAFSNRVLTALGTWSFSIYLLHVPVLVHGFGWMRGAWPEGLADWNAASATGVLLMAVVCTAMSACTYRWIESPFLQRKAKLEN